MGSKEIKEEQKVEANIAANGNEVFDDNYLSNNIEEAKTDFDTACKVYRNYVGSSETKEERIRRINMFRCG